MMVSKRNLLFQGAIFRFYVNVPGCNAHFFTPWNGHFGRGSHTCTKKGDSPSPWLFSPLKQVLGWSFQVPETSSTRFFGGTVTLVKPQSQLPIQSTKIPEVFGMKNNFFKVWLTFKWVWDTWSFCWRMMFETRVKKLSPSHLSLHEWFQNYNIQVLKNPWCFFFNPDFFKRTVSYDYSIHVYKLNFPTKHMIKPIPRPEASRHRVGRWSLVSRWNDNNRGEGVLVSKVLRSYSSIF